jgi:hypothetical protein
VFPVDLAYKRSYSYTLQLKVPPGYEVQELPRDKRISLASGGGSYIRGYQDINGVVMLQSRFVMNRVVFQPRQYPELRELYDQMVAAHAEQIVLRRIEQPADAAESPEGAPGGQAPGAPEPEGEQR